MQDLIVTLVQANQVWENKDANFANYTRLLYTIEHSDIIILPEMFNTGFSMNAINLAEQMNDSFSIDWLKQLAIEKNAAIYTSLIIEENNNYYNRGVFVEPNGTITQYDKRKTFSLAGENEIFTSGTEACIVEFRGWKINLQICYDLRFSEISLNKLVNNIPIYDLLLYVANWPEKRIHHWNSLLIGRAIENQCYAVGVNRVGKDANNLDYSGDSNVVLPDGNVALHLNEEQIISTSISMEFLKDFRKNLPFLKDRS